MARRQPTQMSARNGRVGERVKRRDIKREFGRAASRQRTRLGEEFPDKGELTGNFCQFAGNTVEIALVNICEFMDLGEKFPTRGNREMNSTEQGMKIRN